MKRHHGKGKYAALLLALALSCSLLAAPVQATGDLPPAGEAISDTAQPDPGAAVSSDAGQNTESQSGTGQDTASQPSQGQSDPGQAGSGQSDPGSQITSEPSSSLPDGSGISGPIGGDGIIITPPSVSSEPEDIPGSSVPEEGWESSQPGEFPGDGQSGMEGLPGEGTESGLEGDGEVSTPEGGLDPGIVGEDPDYEPAPPSYSGPVVDSAPNMIASVPETESDPTAFTNQDLEDIRNLASGQEAEGGQTILSGGNTDIPQGGGIFESEDPVQTAGDSTVLVVGVALIVLGAAGIAFAVIRIVLARRESQPAMMEIPDGPRDLYSDSHLEEARHAAPPEHLAPQRRDDEPAALPQDRGYYDDPNDDPYSDYYDDIDGYAGTSARPGEPPQGGENLSQPAAPGQSNGEKPGDDFDWDDFFQNNGNPK